MSSMRELAEQYANRLTEAKDKQFAAKKIVDSLNGLVYIKSQESVSYEYKKSIVQEMLVILRGGDTYYKEFSSQEYLGLVNFILSQIGANKK